MRCFGKSGDMSCDNLQNSSALLHLAIQQEDTANCRSYTHVTDSSSQSRTVLSCFDLFLKRRCGNSDTRKADQFGYVSCEEIESIILKSVSAGLHIFKNVQAHTAVRMNEIVEDLCRESCLASDLKWEQKAQGCSRRTHRCTASPADPRLSPAKCSCRPHQVQPKSCRLDPTPNPAVPSGFA